MENQFKNTYGKIRIDEGRRTEMETVIGSKKNKNAIWIRSSLAVVGLIAVLFIIPATRTEIVNAASRIISVFTANGQEITVEQRTNESVAVVNDVDEKGYALVENGRLYFVLGDIKTDVTDQCSETSYYRYEIVNSDGSRNVIFVGGTVVDYGWVELIFDNTGKYITNSMGGGGSAQTRFEPEDNKITWKELAMYNEGVPCGNWDLDKELYE
jgi:hypothetical protein